jgi:hypothetical protein
MSEVRVGPAAAGSGLGAKSAESLAGGGCYLGWTYEVFNYRHNGQPLYIVFKP